MLLIVLFPFFHSFIFIVVCQRNWLSCSLPPTILKRRDVYLNI
nr:MAG TPA: hypothetical protein [Caudoviricetes sp.]DAW58423.1 MAG TPA: hypothetical protein [Caudoviricetes sp.]